MRALSLEAYPALVLNADMMPLSTMPLSVLNWHDAVRAKVRDSHAVLAEYDREVRSPGRTLRLPAVLMLKEYVRQDRPAALSRWSLFVAHGHVCAYCEKRFPTADLTFDHVVPKSRNGLSTWSNLVPACQACNGRKGDRTPENAGMSLRRKPFHPTCQQLNALGLKRLAGATGMREEWNPWLYWTVELEP